MAALYRFSYTDLALYTMFIPENYIRIDLCEITKLDYKGRRAQDALDSLIAIPTATLWIKRNGQKSKRRKVSYA